MNIVKKARYMHTYLAHTINNFRFLRKELLELHCILSIGCPKIKWFCPNITFLGREWLLEKFGGGGGHPPPPPPPPPRTPVAILRLVPLSNYTANPVFILSCHFLSDFQTKQTILTYLTCVFD